MVVDGLGRIPSHDGVMPEDRHSLGCGGESGGADDQLPSHDGVMHEERHSLTCGGGQGGEDDQLPSHDGTGETKHVRCWDW